MNYKTLVVYNCETCYFITRNKKDYNRHLLSRKHAELNPKTDIIHDDAVINTHVKPLKPTHYQCQYCNQFFKSRTTIYKHKERCKTRKQEQENAQEHEVADVNYIVDTGSNIPTIPPTTAPPTLIPATQTTTEQYLCEVITKNQELTAAMITLIQQNTELQTKMIELCKTGGTAQCHNNTNSLNTNCNNNSFNMNFFLNEQCKDAMNMKDFVNSIQLNLTDLENVGRLGYVEGMSNILIDNLQKTDVYKRPVHCSDVKRETLYVKDDNKWEREGPNHQKMVNAVLAVEHKNVALVSEWAKAHPLCMNSNSRDNETYMKLSKTVTDGEKEGNIQKVIRKVSKKVVVEKDGASVTA